MQDVILAEALRQRAAVQKAEVFEVSTDSDSGSSSKSSKSGKTSKSSKSSKSSSSSSSSRKKSTKKKGRASGHSVSVGNPLGLDTSGLEFATAREFFATRAAASSSGGVAADQCVRSDEAPSRRLQRLREEVGALCAWSEAHGQALAKDVPTSALLPAQREAELLSRELAQTTEVVQHIMDDAAAGRYSDGQSGGPCTTEKHVWLPPRRHQASSAQRLMTLAAASAPSGSQGSSDVSYSLSAPARLDGAPQLACDSEFAAVRELELRLENIRAALGAGAPAVGGDIASEGAAADGSLALVATRLHKRLARLQHVSDDAACERLRASVQLLSADIDVALAEVRRLEALEQEDRESDVGALLADDEEPPAERIQRLHERVARLAPVASRLEEVESHLAEKSHDFEALGAFARDLAGTEARLSNARNLLEATAQAAGKLRVASIESREQLQRNMAALEAKLEARICADAT